MKRTRRKAKSRDERLHHARVAAMPCIACEAWPVHVHHVTSDGFKRITKDHKLVVPLCPECHQNGPLAVHKVGQRSFDAMHGLDLMGHAKLLWEESNG